MDEMDDDDMGVDVLRAVHGYFTGLFQSFHGLFYFARWPIPLDELHRITGKV
jgi:hypothetical protein